NEAHPPSLIIGDLHTLVQTRKKAKAQVPTLNAFHTIKTKWILKNKRDARGIVCRNKARLVAQGHRQEEGIDYTEDWSDEFKALMQSQFEISSMGHLTFFLGLQVDQRRLISWQCKKQTIVATSSCEAEYVVAASCCGQ
nr:hypothetical protein [Tanacetum cinerariifolium]